ncbi:MAG: TolC family outer membrane protein [Stenotrophomonas nitritireducens]|uniref:TolC family outer membrane protein n=1 Tax=Stenotrophomonas TaxID=40323 RepID=UPI001AC9A62F|nr:MULTISPECIES: TolC family outer membrane protein [Stenotrophomonas]MBN8793661.1 TolC family outer membrane protein [Stenotrophomonas nitritireducens]MBN8797379.1 TolC family outer membrane protein [Stenotrophomonas nitritireducens]
MIRRSLALALAVALSPLAANAADLLQVYEMARNGDPQLASAESNRLYTKEGQVQARANLLPSLNGQATLNRARTSQDGVSGSTTATSRRYSIGGEQTLFNWTQFANLRAQREISKAADFDLESANDDLIVRTATTYFNVLVAIESLSAAQTNEAAAKKQFDYADKRLEVGLAPITDVHEARAQYDQARANTILARNTLADAYQALTELTGQPVQGLRSLPEDFRPELPANRGDVDRLVADAITQNPALKAQELKVNAAESSVSAARGGHYPTLSLGGSWGKSASWGDSVGASSSGPDTTTNSIGLTLNVPIFAGGATQSYVRQALAQRDMAQDGYEQQKRALDRNTRNAYQAVVAGISEVEARRLAVVSAQSAYDASQVGLEVGTRTVLDVVQNQRTLFQAKLDYAQARYNFLLSRLQLSQAIGGLDVAEVQDVNRLLTQDAEAQLAPGSMQ